MQFTITGSSSALFSTWLFVEELGVLFDAGDGVSAGLAQKSRKARHVFITHADRDHLAGLLQFHQLNASNGRPTIHYPADCGSFPALRDFMAKFDPQSGPATWNPLRSGDRIDIGSGYSILAQTSDHVEAPDGQTKALGFTVLHTKRVLRPELKGVPGPEIAKLRQEKGQEAVTIEQTEPLLGYSGDSPTLEPSHWPGVRTLLHECTFLEPQTARRGHSDLPQVIAAAAEMDLDALVLFHFSVRYSQEEIRDAIRRHAEQAALPFPVFALWPGELVRDVLKQEPVWAG